MVKHCCWGTCNSDSRYADREHMQGISWIPFPKPFKQPEKCRKWISLCGRRGFSVENVNKSTYICSKHFVEGRPTPLFPDPIPASGTKIDRARAQRGKRRVLFRPELDVSSVSSPKRVKFELVSEDKIEVAANEEVSVQTVEEHVEEEPEEKEDLTSTDHTYCHTLKVERPKVKTVDQSCQTMITLEDLSGYEDINLQDRGSMQRSFIMQDVLKDDKSCKFYTGVSLSIFFLLLSLLKERASRLNYWRGNDTNMENNRVKNVKVKGPKRVLTVKEEMVLTLIRLRRGIDTTTLGGMFGIKAGTVSKIFCTWIVFLYQQLKFLIAWPSREQVKKRLPKCFKYFPKTRCIIDCTEFFVQKPSLPSSQRITWSSYKHHNTFKSLVGITPTGTFSFISHLFTGSISDKRIVEESGFLDKVEWGDDIMADRGFLIRGNLALKGATLNIPPFSFMKQLSGAAVTKTRRIARARIHVERAIGRLKCFQILQGVIPLKLKPMMDQISCVCAVLCNLDSQLVK